MKMANQIGLGIFIGLVIAAIIVCVMEWIERAKKK